MQITRTAQVLLLACVFGFAAVASADSSRVQIAAVCSSDQQNRPYTQVKYKGASTGGRWKFGGSVGCGSTMATFTSEEETYTAWRQNGPQGACAVHVGQDNFCCIQADGTIVNGRCPEQQ